MQYSTIGQFVKTKREAMNISLNAFAVLCEIEPATLSRFENGKSDIYFQTFPKIAKGFNLLASSLLTEYECNCVIDKSQCNSVTNFR